MLSLRAGEVAPTLHLAPGNATVLTFYDETGAAWPVMSVTVGNPTAYSAQEAGDKGKTNMVVISPISNFADANLVVTLVDYPVPVLFSLVTGDGTVDYRLDVGITSRGPNAQYDIAQGSDLEPTNDPTMQSFVDGLPPKGSVKIDTTNPDVEAWRLGDMDYIRTPLELLSPAFIGRQMHPSGIKVYSITDTPVLMFSQDGRMTMVELDR
jgi:intracellular multiplication protein IcmK